MATSKKKIRKLGLDELFWRLRAEGCSNNTFWIRVKDYLYSRIRIKNLLSDFEIELLNKYVGEMKNNEKIPLPIREDVSRYSTRLIVMSKNTNKLEFVDKVARNDIDCINNFKTEDIKLFFETAIEYSLDCISILNYLLTQ